MLLLKEPRLPEGWLYELDGYRALAAKVASERSCAIAGGSLEDQAVS